MAGSIYWFEEIDRSSLSVAGGKGANLGEMTKAGLPVPPGFCVSADAYFEFIYANAIDAVIRKELEGLDTEDTNALQAASDVVKAAVVKGAIPSDVRADIVKAYNKLCGAGIIPSVGEELLVAVRSSATAEDLPEASFAGQQATFLNVKGSEEVVAKVRECWASLFEARAIYYRCQNKFDHLKVGLCAVVQKMVQSESSGIMFTVDPISQDENKIVIEAGFGLGEAIVSGQITPDHYAVTKDSMQIVESFTSHQEDMIILTDKGNEHVAVAEELREARKISDEQVLELAAIGKKIEEHYGFPQDIEWAIDKEGLYIVQSRPITTLKRKPEAGSAVPGAPDAEVPVPQAYSAQSSSERPSSASSVGELLSQISGEVIVPASSSSAFPFASTPSSPPTFNVVSGASEVSSQVASAVAFGVPAAGAKVLLQGMGASPGIASGPVKVISDAKGVYLVKNGDVLVAPMTTPDFVPAMKRACAIVTDEGGSTCHAAIVSRELGIPCIVGTRTATKSLSTGQVITVDAKRGVVYEGKVALEEPKTPAQQVADSVAASAPLVTGTKLYVNLAEPELAEKVAALNVDGVGLLRAEFMIAGLGKHPKAFVKEGKAGEFVDALAKGLRKVCGAFHPRPVVYRATDFKTNEYKNLEGGAEFEPHEENPMIGYRGCFRYVKDPECFNLELEAIKRVREQYGMRNLHLMIPMVRTVHEFKLVKQLVEQAGLHKSRDFKLGIMCEVPSTVILAEEFCLAGADFFSIGSNDLTQLTLGIDRDNPIVAEEFDERDEAIYRSLKQVISACHKHGVKVGICGQAPSVYQEFAEKLVEYGIDSISCNNDVVDSTRRTIASAEKRVLLDKARRE